MLGLSPRTQVGLAVWPEGAHGGWSSRQRHGAGLSGGGGRRAPGAGLGGGVAWSGGAGADDHGQQRIEVTDGSRESQPSGLELLPDLPPRHFVLGGLTIAPQLAVGEGALGFWPALREVFLAPGSHAAGATSRPTCSASCLSSACRPGGRFWSSFSAP
jgi:hypothetical protein